MLQIKRVMKIPKGHFFLFGPRGTGKSTWHKQKFKPHFYINLLLSKTFLEYTAEPHLLRSRLEFLKSDEVLRIVIDEIQKCPQLLDEVHALIEDFPGRIQFALTGSSARKLRRSNANLLGGRDLTRSFFPFVTYEVSDSFSIESVLKYGLLPKVYLSNSEEDKKDYLRAYTQTYLKEEVQQEALVRNLPDYVRFLKHLAIKNGEVLNLSNLS